MRKVLQICPNKEQNIESSKCIHMIMISHMQKEVLLKLYRYENSL